MWGSSHFLSATLVSLPNSFVNGQVIDATQVMANYNAIVAVVNGNIDHSNVATALGLLASDIKPTTALGGTIGGTAAITFPNRHYDVRAVRFFAALHRRK